MRLCLEHLVTSYLPWRLRLLPHTQCVGRMDPAIVFLVKSATPACGDPIPSLNSRASGIYERHFLETTIALYKSSSAPLRVLLGVLLSIEQSLLTPTRPPKAFAILDPHSYTSKSDYSRSALPFSPSLVTQSPKVSLNTVAQIAEALSTRRLPSNLNSGLITT